MATVVPTHERAGPRALGLRCARRRNFLFFLKAPPRPHFLARRQLKEQHFLCDGCEPYARALVASTLRRQQCHPRVHRGCSGFRSLCGRTISVFRGSHSGHGLCGTSYKGRACWSSSGQLTNGTQGIWRGPWRSLTCREQSTVTIAASVRIRLLRPQGRLAILDRKSFLAIDRVLEIALFLDCGQLARANRCRS